MSTARRRPHTSRGGRASSRSVRRSVSVSVSCRCRSFGVLGRRWRRGRCDRRAGDEGGAIWWREGRLREAEARAVWRPRRARGRTRRLVRTGSRGRGIWEVRRAQGSLDAGRTDDYLGPGSSKYRESRLSRAWTRTRATIGGERLGWILLMIVLFIGRGLMSDNPLKCRVRLEGGRCCTDSFRTESRAESRRRGERARHRAGTRGVFG